MVTQNRKQFLVVNLTEQVSEHTYEVQNMLNSMDDAIGWSNISEFNNPNVYISIFNERQEEICFAFMWGWSSF